MNESVPEPTEREQGPNVLAQEILEMAKIDQEARLSDSMESEQIQEIDLSHTKRMQEIVAEHGWPTIDLVGEKASHAAWLLVQHADLNPDFQEEVLAQLKDLPKEQISQGDIAYLEDRVRVSKSQPTLYGTQFHMRDDGKLVLEDIEDPENVDVRREAMGMASLEEGTKSFYSRQPKEEIPEEWL